MRDSFSTYHPAVNFLYFCAVLLCCMFFMHPVFLVISFISAMLYSAALSGWKALRLCLLAFVPTLLLTTLINALFNHAGVTVLLYVNDNPLTLESILYGAAFGLMFLTAILWFSCYNAVMTSDKFIYLFGRVIPSLSLIFSMVLRFVPRFQAQGKDIARAQKCIGQDSKTGSVFIRAKRCMKLLSILTTWGLENAVDTADSMKARGYGLKGRTSFSLYRFDKRDSAALLTLAVLISLALTGWLLGESSLDYFPAITLESPSPLSLLFYVFYLLLCCYPLLLNLLYEIRWRRTQR